MVRCPKCNTEKINFLTIIYRGHETEALCLCEECLTGFEYYAEWLETKKENIENYRIIKY